VLVDCLMEHLPYYLRGKAALICGPDPVLDTVPFMISLKFLFVCYGLDVVCPSKVYVLETWSPGWWCWGRGSFKRWAQCKVIRSWSITLESTDAAFQSELVLMRAICYRKESQMLNLSGFLSCHVISSAHASDIGVPSTIRPSPEAKLMKLPYLELSAKTVW
jgi:hypothetical protein